jgi:AcrR family transcriptional regulator
MAAGLRERKRRRTFEAIHQAGMRLFAERGYADVTVADIADAADISRATVFAYYPAKEDIVLGDSPLAIESLRAALAEAGAAPVVETVRDWVRTLTGWVEDDVILQRRLAAEVPAVAAARSRVERAIEAVIDEALRRELGPERKLAARLVAGSLTAALMAVESEAADRVAAEGPVPGPEEVDKLLDQALAFVAGGLDRLGP